MRVLAISILILAPEYVEISPLGEVDSRSAVLGFYAPEKKPAAGMRVVFVLRLSAGQWRLVSSQYTPIREKRG